MNPVNGVARQGALGHVPPWSLRMHANFAAVQTMAVLIFLPSSVSSKLDRQSHHYCGRLLQKTSAIFVFADLTPDGFHIWTVTTNFGTRAPRALAPPPMEQNSGDATESSYN